MNRLNDWPSRFAALVESVRSRQFAWGSHDCCLWAADAVLATTGHDPAAQWRGVYSTESAAHDLVASLGGLPAVAGLGGVEIDPLFAIAGDVGLVRWPDGVVSLGVSSGDLWMCVGDSGLVFFSRDAAIRTWGVGRE
jgi:hypothetical protein